MTLTRLVSLYICIKYYTNSFALSHSVFYSDKVFKSCKILSTISPYFFLIPKLKLLKHFDNLMGEINSMLKNQIEQSNPLKST